MPLLDTRRPLVQSWNWEIFNFPAKYFMNSFGKMAHRNIWTGRLRSRIKRRKLGQSLVYHSQWTSKLFFCCSASWTNSNLLFAAKETVHWVGARPCVPLNSCWSLSEGRWKLLFVKKSPVLIKPLLLQLPHYFSEQQPWIAAPSCFFLRLPPSEEDDGQN